MNNGVLKEDLDYIFTETKSLWEEIRNNNIFISGGTGFFGKWLLQSFIKASLELNLNAKAVVLTRDFESFKLEVPSIANSPFVEFCTGNIKDFQFPEGEFSHIVHAAATSAKETYLGEDPLSKFDTIVVGTRHILDFAIKCGAKKFLLVSSGAVYGRNIKREHISEEWCVAPLSFKVESVWGESKRCAEFLCSYYHKKYGLETKIVRCFSFVGPYLQLDIHYAIGNFIRDVLRGNQICVKSDGSAFRSYLYAADLVIWLWTILFKGKSCYPYNVGSENEISIKDLSYLVARCVDKSIKVNIEGKSSSVEEVDYYVPSTRRAREELGLKERIILEEAIRRTINYYKE